MRYGGGGGGGTAGILVSYPSNLTRPSRHTMPYPPCPSYPVPRSAAIGAESAPIAAECSRSGKGWGIRYEAYFCLAEF